MNFVLDNSVSMRWLQPSVKQTDQVYALDVLDSFNSDEDEVKAMVSCIWRLEVANVLLGCEKRNEITIQESDAFTTQLQNLNIFTDIESINSVFLYTTQFARRHNLSSYDASYLELAIRENLPLATLDSDLEKAAKNEGVELWLR